LLPILLIFFVKADLRQALIEQTFIFEKLKNKEMKLIKNLIRNYELF